MREGLICGISGRARSGKNQLAKFIIEGFEKSHNRKFYEASFANELKYMCKFQFGLGDNQLWGNKKEEPDERFTKHPIRARPFCAGLGKDKMVDSYTHSTPREIMQELGAFYRKIDYDFWIKSLRKFLDHELLKGHKDFIITDVRHVNEAEFIKSNKGFLIRIDRDLDNEIHGVNHESETGLDNYKDFDMYIDNNGDLADLKIASYNIVNAILSMEKLINNRRIM